MTRHVCETPGVLVGHGFYFQCYFSMLTSHFGIQNKSLSLEPEVTSQIMGQKSGPCLVFSFGPCRSGVVTWSEGTLHLWRVWVESTGCNPSWLCCSLGEGACHQETVQGLWDASLSAELWKKGVGYLCPKNCVKFLLQEQI